MLIDTATIGVKAGDGGNGCSSFRREKYVPRGGPNGGDGGRGGDVIIEATRGCHTLLDFHYRKKYRATSGRHGGGKNRHGRGGEDVVLPVPVGTLVKVHDTGEILADLDEAGKRLLAARGGRGGRGNARFATSTQRAPIRADDGEQGQELVIDLELKLIADVGLVGLPNAGKSTLLSKISAARPKIADFPFTTTSPVLGLVSFGDAGGFVAADLPGLIEGAHAGKGLGHRFLRHIERTRLLVVLLDASGTDPGSDYTTLMNELVCYGQGLSEKPLLVALTKMDIAPDAREKEWTLGGERVLFISALTGEGLEELKRHIWAELEELDRSERDC